MENLELNGAARASLLVRQARRRHRSYRLQGFVADALAASARSAGDRRQSSADDNSQSFRRREDRYAVQESFFGYSRLCQDLPI